MTEVRAVVMTDYSCIDPQLGYCIYRIQSFWVGADAPVFRIPSFRTKSSAESTFFLFPGSNRLEPASCCLCELFEIYLKNLSLFTNIFFGSIELR